MSAIAAKIEQFGANACRITWANMKGGDVGEPATHALYQDRSVQVTGTFQGAAVAMQGTNHKPEDDLFVALTDMRGNDLNILSPKLEQIEDCTYALRPVVSGGDADTDLTVVIFARGGR